MGYPPRTTGWKKAPSFTHKTPHPAIGEYRLLENVARLFPVRDIGGSSDRRTATRDPRAGYTNSLPELLSYFVSGFSGSLCGKIGRNYLGALTGDSMSQFSTDPATRSHH